MPDTPPGSSPPGSSPPEDPVPRPKPQYGEYAPPGWVSPYELEQRQERERARREQQESRDLDSGLTRPAFDTGTGAAPGLQQAPPWDRPLTNVLLAIGMAGMLFGVYGGAMLPTVIEQAGILQDVDLTPPPWTQAAGIAVAVAQIVLYALAVIGSRVRLNAGRRAFWVPLAAGVLAAICYHGVTTAAALAAGLIVPS